MKTMKIIKTIIFLILLTIPYTKRVYAEPYISIAEIKDANSFNSGVGRWKEIEIPVWIKGYYKNETYFNKKTKTVEYKKVWVKGYYKMVKKRIWVSYGRAVNIDGATITYTYKSKKSKKNKNGITRMGYK